MNSIFPLVQLPSKLDQTLYLIQEELKSRKLFHILREAGWEECHYQLNLDSLILRSIGFEENNDEACGYYFKIMDKRSRKISTDKKSVAKQALKVYQELIEEKKRAK
jgi:hypothetical protein